MKLTFYGAAGEVTGSCHVLDIGDHRVLLDCGLIQGAPADEARNRDPFPFDPAAVDAVILSHAHLDHSGRLPLLVRRGFRGRIVTHNATRDLVRVLLRDAAYLAGRDAEHINRRRARKGLAPTTPLFDADDVDATVTRIEGHRYGDAVDLLPGVSVTFLDAGHILGSAACRIELTSKRGRKTLVFSGDLGPYGSPILADPEPAGPADLVLMECTYGGRLHREREETITEFGEIIAAARAAGGNVLIPAFSIGRSQEVLYQLGANYDAWELDNWQVFLDSPMAIEASEIYWNYPHLYDEQAQHLRRQLSAMPRLSNLHLTRTPDESRVINRLHSGAIIIAGSGMCTGGRILHHLKHNLWKRSTHVVITGYQARGTLGRRLVDGQRRVRIFGETIRVGATIHTLGGLSAHGDERDLMRWYDALGPHPPVYLVHGEPDSADALATGLERRFGADVTIAEPGAVVDLHTLTRAA